MYRIMLLSLQHITYGNLVIQMPEQLVSRCQLAAVNFGVNVDHSKVDAAQARKQDQETTKLNIYHTLVSDIVMHLDSGKL